MRETCKRCGKRFTPTSWTKDNWWRQCVCPACIIDLLENNGAKDQVMAAEQTRARGAST